MSKWRFQKNSFVAGQISPTAMGRTDLPQYPHACKLMKNAIPLLSGGAYRRPGTRFEKEYAAASYFVPRLLPFRVNENESYMLWLLKAVGGAGSVAGFRATSNTTTASTAISCSGSHPYLAARAGGVPPGVFTNTQFDEWHEVQVAQSVDVMTLVHPNYKPRRITRTAIDTFTIDEFDAGLTTTALRDAWPYFAQNTTTATLSIDTATVGTGRTLTAASVPAGTTVFTSSMVGAMMKVDNGGTIGCALITGFTSATVVTVTVIVAFGAAGTPVTTWWESAWSDRRGWPRAVDFHQGRQVYGGTLSSPDSLWFSETNDYNQLSKSTVVDPTAPGAAADAFTLTPTSQETNPIQWIASERTLLVGTANDEWVVTPAYGVDTVGFGSTNVQITRQSSVGSSYYQAKRVGRELFFITKPKDEVRALVFNETEQAYIDEAVQILFDEYPKAAVTNAGRQYRSFAWDRSRRTMWACDTAGNLFGMTRDRTLQLTAWHTHEMGGYDESKQATGTTISMGVTTTDPAYFSYSGTVHSVACAPNPITGTDDVWMVVARKINSVWTYQIERMIGGVAPYETAYSARVTEGLGAYFVDSAVFQIGDYPPGPEDYIFSNLDHLEGETPVGTAFNSKGIFTVEGNAIVSGDTTLQPTRPTNMANETTVVVLGLGYTTDIVPVRPDVGSQLGSAQGAIKRIHEVNVRFYKTLAAKVGGIIDDSPDLETLIFRTGSLAMGLSAQLYSKDKKVKLNADYDRDAYVMLRTDKALPFAVVSLSMEGMTSDG